MSKLHKPPQTLAGAGGPQAPWAPLHTGSTPDLEISFRRRMASPVHLLHCLGTFNSDENTTGAMDESHKKC